VDLRLDFFNDAILCFLGDGSLSARCVNPPEHTVGIKRHAGAVLLDDDEASRSLSSLIRRVSLATLRVEADTATANRHAVVARTAVDDLVVILMAERATHG
jgi:hypothetical protein